MDRTRVIALTLALIAAIAVPLCASSGWARGLGVLALCGSGSGVVCNGDTDTIIVPSSVEITGTYQIEWWNAQQFTVASVKSATGLIYSVGKSGGDPTLYGEIWTDSAGVPGALVSGASASLYPVEHTVEDKTIMFPATVTLPAGTYWAIFRPVGGAVAYGYRTPLGECPVQKYSPNEGATWTAVTSCRRIQVLGCD